jgi:hypothetical protein
MLSNSLDSYRKVTYFVFERGPSRCAHRLLRNIRGRFSASVSCDRGGRYLLLLTSHRETSDSTLGTAAGLVEIVAESRKVVAQNDPFGKTVNLDVTDVPRLNVNGRGADCAGDGTTTSVALMFGDLPLLGVPGAVAIPSLWR